MTRQWAKIFGTWRVLVTPFWMWTFPQTAQTDFRSSASRGKRQPGCALRFDRSLSIREPATRRARLPLPSRIQQSAGGCSDRCFSGISNRRAPMWMALRLAAAGVRSLNLLVDISNFVQIETGQPLHFYDAAKIRGGKIVARAARDGEKVVTLDGVERMLPVGTPVIADGEGPIGIAGIMGGADSGVTMQTQELVVESPNFVGKRVRRASIALGLRTEGALRHEKDLPLELPEVGRKRAAQLLIHAGAKPSRVLEVGEQPGPLRRVRARAARVNRLLGSDLLSCANERCTARHRPGSTR